MEPKKRICYDRKVANIKSQLNNLKQEVIDALYLIDSTKEEKDTVELMQSDDYELLCDLYFRLPGTRPTPSQEVKEEKKEEVAKQKVLGFGKPKTILPKE